MPKITGIMLVLNEMFYIKASVTSILQHVDEVLIMDGGSKDGTYEWLQKFSSHNNRAKIILNPQGDTRHYHPSWNQPARWNKLIELSTTDWIFILGADECVCDHMKLRKIIDRNPKSVAFDFPRYAVTDVEHYTPNWYPDRQLRLFNRTACGGLRFKNVPRHCTLKTNRGSGSNPPTEHCNKYLVHYHHAFGPKKHKLGKRMTTAKLPSDFRHPKSARHFIIKHPEIIDFKYDFRLYGKMGWIPNNARN